MEAIIFPTVERLLIEALGPSFPDASVHVSVPANRPERFITVSRVGGPRRNMVTDQPMVVFQAWARTDFEAAELGAELRARVYALAQTEHPTGWVRAVREVGGLQRFPDPVADVPRYQFTAQLDTRGKPLGQPAYKT